MDNGSYPEHVFIARAMEANPILDKLLGGFLAICLVVGTTGNIISLNYFLSTKRATLAEKLYAIMCSIDFCTCIFHFPVMMSLLRGREPGLFLDLWFCGAWTVSFEFVQSTTTFLVMLISLTRTIKITFPFIKIHKRLVLWSFGGYCVLSFVHFLVGITVDMTFAYFGDVVYCVTTCKYEWFNKMLNIFSSMQTGIPSLIIFLSFVISALNLRRASVNAEGQQRNTKATVTITIFTFIFIMCNTPFFVLMVLLIMEQYFSQAYSYPGYFFKSCNWMSLHSWVTAKIGCVVLNATLNPLMYVFRMQKLKSWVCRSKLNRSFRSISDRRNRTSVSQGSSRVQETRFS